MPPLIVSKKSATLQSIKATYINGKLLKLRKKPRGTCHTRRFDLDIGKSDRISIYHHQQVDGRRIQRRVRRESFLHPVTGDDDAIGAGVRIGSARNSIVLFDVDLTMFRHRGRSGQMVTGSLEPVLISNPVDGESDTIGGEVRVRSAGNGIDILVYRGDFLLLDFGSVFIFDAASIISDRIGV